MPSTACARALTISKNRVWFLKCAKFTICLKTCHPPAIYRGYAIHVERNRRRKFLRNPFMARHLRIRADMKGAMRRCKCIARRGPAKRHSGRRRPADPRRKAFTIDTRHPQTRHHEVQRRERSLFGPRSHRFWGHLGICHTCQCSPSVTQTAVPCVVSIQRTPCRSNASSTHSLPAFVFVTTANSGCTASRSSGR